ncbi:MAG: hypothetical protein QOG87_1806 [Actinomycetota bacterium]
MTGVAHSRSGMAALWYGFSVGPAAWAAHIVGDAALVRYACNDPSMHWWLHGLTVITGVPTVIGLAICLRVARSIPAPEDAPSPEGRTRFLAVVGAYIAGISLALVLLEGAYVFFISDCA